MKHSGSFLSFSTRLLLLLLCGAVLPNGPDLVSARAPTHVNGNYTFACAADASLTHSLSLAANGKVANVGSLTVPIYCGPPNPTSPDSLVTAWNNYQAKLDTAASAFKTGCNQLVSNLALPPRDQDCQNAANQWRSGLAELNDISAGLAPASLSMTVKPGGLLQEIAGVWETTSKHVTKNGKSLPLVYLINRGGAIYGAAVLNGAVNIVSNNAACGGLMAVQSAGSLYGLTSATLSKLTNEYSGVLACAVAAGNLWMAVAVTAKFNVKAIQTK